MAKVKIPKNYFLIKVEKPYEDTIELKNGKRIILNYTFDPLKHARQYGTVYQVPDWLPKGLELDVKIGDKVYFHHMITASTGNVSVDKKFSNSSSQDLISDNKVRWLDEENLYSVHWDFMYARVRDETGIFLKPGVEDIELYGYIRHLSDWMKDQGIKEGDEVVFSVNSEYDMKIEGDVLLRMRNQDILAKVEDGERK